MRAVSGVGRHLQKLPSACCTGTRTTLPSGLVSATPSLPASRCRPPVAVASGRSHAAAQHRRLGRIAVHALWYLTTAISEVVVVGQVAVAVDPLFGTATGMLLAEVVGRRLAQAGSVSTNLRSARPVFTWATRAGRGIAAPGGSQRMPRGGWRRTSPSAWGCRSGRGCRRSGPAKAAVEDAMDAGARPMAPDEAGAALSSGALVDVTCSCRFLPKKAEPWPCVLGVLSGLASRTTKRPACQTSMSFLGASRRVARGCVAPSPSPGYRVAKS